MPDYSNGKIYKVTSSKVDLPYIGSTTQSLSSRLSGHRRDYQQCNSGNVQYHSTSSFEIVQHDDAIITLLEEWPCNDREELLMKEREWFDKIPNLNKNRPFVSAEEYKEIFRLDAKKHYHNNKEKELKNRAEYAKNNIAKITQRISKKYNCDCGSRYTHGNRSVHLKTQGHKSYLRKIEIEQLIGMHNGMQTRLTIMRKQFKELPEHL
jgi:hypothetical protein